MVKSHTGRIARNTLILYFRMLFLMCISLYTGRVILQALGIEDYGIYNLVGGFVTMFSLVSVSLTNACSRFLNFEIGSGNNERINVVFSTSVTIQYALAAIILLLCETFGIWYINNVMVIPEDRLVAAHWVFQFSIFSFCMNLITVPYNAAIIAHERMKAFAYVSIFEGISKLVICYIVMFSSFDRLITYGFLLLVVQSIVRLSYQFYCHRQFGECHYRFIIDQSLLKKMFSYSGWHILGNTASIVNVQGVNLVLNFFFGPILNAAKGVSNQVLSAVHGFASNFMMAVNPQITQSYAKGNISYMLNLVYKGSRFSFYMLFLISLPIIVNAEYLLQLWLKTVPEYAVIFTQLTLVVTMISSMSTPLITAQNATGKVRNYQIIVGGIQLLNLPISFIVLKLGFSPVSVMLVTIIIEIASLFARFIMIPFYITDFDAVDYIKKVVLNCLCVAIVASLIPISSIIVFSNSFGMFLTKIIISIASAIIAILFVGCNRHERTMILTKIRKYIKK